MAEPVADRFLDGSGVDPVEVNVDLRDYFSPAQGPAMAMVAPTQAADPEFGQELASWDVMYVSEE